MNVLSRGLAAAACAAALVAAAAAPASAATHTIRVEGETRTLLAATPATVPDSTQPIGGAVSPDCAWNEPAGPLHVATAGNWDQRNFVETILGETQTGSKGWFLWVNGKYAGGACFTTLQGESDILFTAGAYDANYNPVDLPLTVRDVPTRVTPGQAFTVAVDQIQPETSPEGYYTPDTGKPVPAQGATVTAGGATATVGADGKATLTVSAAGPLTVQATRGTGSARSRPVGTCASNGSDGACGTAVPKPATPAAPAKDTTAPKASIASLGKTKRISAAKAPKLLQGKVVEAGGVRMVKLRLTRTVGKRCEAWSAKRERFIRRPKCGASSGWWWNVGDKADWEYQLPAKLPKGRYVLDVKAIDQAYNRDEERRPGENRVVFEVR